MINVDILAGGVVIRYDKHHRSTLKYALYPLLNSLTEIQWKKDWKTKKSVKTEKARFYIDDELNCEYRFHIAFKDEIITTLKSSTFLKRVNITHIIKPQPLNCDFKYTNTNKMPYKRQPEYIDFLTNREHHTRVLPSSPGSGKTLCAIFSMCRINEPTVIFLAPSLFDNWIDSIEELTNIGKDDIYCIGGKDNSIYDFMHLHDRDVPKLVLVSLNAFQNLIKDYSEGGNVSPEAFFDKGKFGLKIVDEAHRWIHFHCLADMYSNVKTHIYLTGTLMAESPFLANMENTLFPMADRCAVDAHSNHIKLRTYSYGYRNLESLPKHIGAMGYHQAKYEGEIFKKAGWLRGYFDMLIRIFEHDFYSIRNKGERAVIFFAKVDLVKAFTELLEETYPDLNVVPYLAGHREDVYEDADVIVSTTKKSGTGTDFSNLIYVLQTIMVASKAENFQNILRLRSRDDGNTKFSYIWCRNIRKHRDYHQKRLKDLQPLFAKIEHYNVSQLI